MVYIMTKTLLFAEDDKEFGEATKFFLEANGWNVVWVNDGRKAWILYERQKPDVLLLDLQMPKLDGLALIRQIREAGGNTPIVLYSGTLNDDKVVEALESGADDVVAKGISPMVLLARLEKQYENALVYPGKAHVYFLAKGVVFNSENGELKIGEQKQILRGQEAILLKLLCGRKNEWVEKAFLCEVLWTNKVSNKDGRLQKCVAALKDCLKEAGAVEMCQEGAHVRLQVEE